jgi:3-dehydroquinate dehydratase-2
MPKTTRKEQKNHKKNNQNGNLKTASSPRSKSRSLHILVANGVNLDLLGRREPEIYGHDNLKTLENLLRKNLRQATLEAVFTARVKLSFFQTNDEAQFLKEISKPYDGALINAGAWTHTSLAIADRLVGLGLPFVEVHISDTSRREDFRHHSFMAQHAIKVVSGQGIHGYWAAMLLLMGWLEVTGSSQSIKGL